MNLPHPCCMIAALRRWPQLRRSWYVAAARRPVLPEWWLGRNDAARIRRLFHDMAVDRSRFPPDTLDVYAAAARKPGALTAMLNRYRAAVRHRVAIGNGGRVDLPVLIVWGEEDRALGAETLDGTGRYVGDLTIRRLPGVSHWVQQAGGARGGERHPGRMACGAALTAATLPGGGRLSILPSCEPPCARAARTGQPRF